MDSQRLQFVVLKLAQEVRNCRRGTAASRAIIALTLVDDCHATGFLGPNGRGSAAFRGVEGRIDILTGTFGKALGGAMGGFVAARKSVVDLLRQRSRPYLFSNALAPAVCGASLAAIEISRSLEGDILRERLSANAPYFRNEIARQGFKIISGEHPIVPIMLGEAHVAQRIAEKLLLAGVYVTGFSYPVVPKGQARIRVQLSAAHTQHQLEEAVAAFAKVGRAKSVIP